MSVDAGNPTGTTVPGAGGSAGEPAPGTGAEPAVGSEVVEQLNGQIEQLRQENERLNNNFRQLLGEKSNTEAERRELETRRAELERGQRYQQQMEEDVAVVSNPNGRTAEDVAAAAGRLVAALGTQMYQTRQHFQAEIRRVEEKQKAATVPGVLPEVVSEATALVDSGDEASMDAAIDKVIGKRAREGKPWNATPAPPPPAPPGAGPTPPRPQPAGTPVQRPVASATRSVPNTGWAVPPVMSQNEYLALPPEQFKLAFAARREGKMTLTP